MELRNVTALVAGGATGLGKAFAETLLSHGGKVIIMDSNALELQRTAAILHEQYGTSRVCSLVQDTATPGSFIRAFDVAAVSLDSAVNVVVNDTGISRRITHFDCNTPHSWESAVTIDSVTLMRTTLEAAEQMEAGLPRGKEGVIVNLAMVGGLVEMPFWSAYAAAKAAVLEFTKSMYSLKSCRNIRVMALCPGFVDTAVGHFITDAFPGAMRSRCGLVAVETVTQAFVRAIEDGRNAGRCMIVMEGQAIYYEDDFTDSTLTFPTWRSQVTI